jgi:hypothetical protein
MKNLSPEISKVLRKIFGSVRDEVTGDWRSLDNVELYYL